MSLPPTTYIDDSSGFAYFNSVYTNTLNAYGNTQQSGITGLPVIQTPSLAAGNLYQTVLIGNGVSQNMLLYPVIQDAGQNARIGSCEKRQGSSSRFGVVRECTREKASGARVRARDGKVVKRTKRKQSRYVRL